MEDPFLFATPRGLHVLMHYFRADNCTAKAAEAGKDAKKVCANIGNHAFAPSVPRLLPGNNGAATGADVEFFLAPPGGPMAGGYSAAVRFDNSTDVAFSHREEPKMLLEWSDAAGDYVPTYLFNVVVENQVAPSNGWAHLESYIFVSSLLVRLISHTLPLLYLYWSFSGALGEVCLHASAAASPLLARSKTLFP